MFLYHYFDKKTGPFRNLSNLSEEEANKVLLTIKSENKEFHSRGILVVAEGIERKEEFYRR